MCQIDGGRLLYKGKGDVSLTGSYRGVALESVAFKLLTRLMARRIEILVDPLLPEEQFGFRPGR